MAAAHPPTQTTESLPQLVVVLVFHPLNLHLQPYDFVNTVLISDIVNVVTHSSASESSLTLLITVILTLWQLSSSMPISATTTPTSPHHFGFPSATAGQQLSNLS
jgi:hypothetical protein